MNIRETARAIVRGGGSDENGFTLIELLIVVIVIGILAAIAIPVYVGAQTNARESAVISDTSNLRTAVLALDLTNNTMPAALPSTATSLTSSWTSAGATWSTFTTKMVYKPGSGTAFCVAALSSTGAVFSATDTKGVAPSAQTTVDAACP